MRINKIEKNSSSPFFAIATASILLMMSSLAQADKCKFFTDFSDNKDGTVTDVRNGLIWKRCSEGREFNNGTCTGTPIYAYWDEAQSIAKRSRFLNKDDWRLPTASEFVSVMGNTDECKNTTGTYVTVSKALASIDDAVSKQTSDFLDFTYWSSTRGRRARLLQGKGEYLHASNENSSIEYASLNNDFSVRLVREGRVTGGEVSSEFAAERAAYQRQEDNKQARQRKEEARQHQAAQEQERKVAAFRKSLKEGDDTSSGVVIEIKGNLVKIQTNDSQCSQRDYKGNCTNYINTPAEKWFKRSEVYSK